MYIYEYNLCMRHKSILTKCMLQLVTVLKREEYTFRGGDSVEMDFTSLLVRGLSYKKRSCSPCSTLNRKEFAPKGSKFFLF